MIDRIIKNISIACIICSIFIIWGCSEDTKTNTVDPDQVNVDGSSNYEYIFKARIQKEKEQEQETRRKNF